jgi:hypothetical protein
MQLCGNIMEDRFMLNDYNMQRCAVFTVLGSYKVQIDHYHEINTLDNNHQQGYILDTDLARIHWIELYDEGYRPGADYADVFKVV